MIAVEGETEGEQVTDQDTSKQEHMGVGLYKYGDP